MKEDNPLSGGVSMERARLAADKRTLWLDAVSNLFLIVFDFFIVFRFIQQWFTIGQGTLDEARSVLTDSLTVFFFVDVFSLLVAPLIVFGHVHLVRLWRTVPETNARLAMASFYLCACFLLLSSLIGLDMHKNTDYFYFWLGITLLRVTSCWALYREGLPIFRTWMVAFTWLMYMGGFALLTSVVTVLMFGLDHVGADYWLVSVIGFIFYCILAYDRISLHPWLGHVFKPLYDMGVEEDLAPSMARGDEENLEEDVRQKEEALIIEVDDARAQEGGFRWQDMNVSFHVYLFIVLLTICSFIIYSARNLSQLTRSDFPKPFYALSGDWLLVGNVVAVLFFVFMVLGIIFAALYAEERDKSSE